MFVVIIRVGIDGGQGPLILVTNIFDPDDLYDKRNIKMTGVNRPSCVSHLAKARCVSSKSAVTT